jgi:serine/threonine-protein kinase RsbW
MAYNFKIPCEKDRLSDIREFLTSVLSRHEIPEKEMNALILAVDEVCANLIIHSHNCNPEEYIELTVDILNNSEIIFEIVDRGIGFNINEYQEPSLNEIVNQRRKGGMGLMLVKRIMDEIELVRGKKENIYRLLKRYNINSDNSET